MIEKFRNNRNLAYFFAYNVAFIGFGMLVAGLGPVIPYLSAKFGVVETQFNMYFMYRAIGFVIGAICSKFTHKFMNYHQTMILSSLGSSIPFIFFAYSDSFFMCGIYAFIGSLFASLLEISVVLSVIATHKGNQEDFWLQITYGSMSLGALIIPLIIEQFNQQGMIAIVILLFLVIPFYIKYESPQYKQEQLVQNLLENDKQKPKQKLQLMAYKHQMILGLILFIYFGEEIGFSGWVSSYTVLLGAQTKEEATIINTIFWASMTFFRFTLPMILQGAPHTKFYTLIKFQLGTLIFSFICEKAGWIVLGAYTSALFLGFAFSAMYPLILALPIFFKKQLSHEVSSNLLILGVFGEGLITSIIGAMMNSLGTHTFYPSILFFVLIKLGLLIFLVNTWLHEKQLKKTVYEIQMQEV